MKTLNVYQGSRTERGAQTTAVLISILETARERNVDFADLLKLSLVVGTTRKQITGKLFNNKGISATQAAELEIIGG